MSKCNQSIQCNQSIHRRIQGISDHPPSLSPHFISIDKMKHLVLCTALALAPAALAHWHQAEGKSIEYTPVPGYFLQDDDATDPNGFDYVSTVHPPAPSIRLTRPLTRANRRRRTLASLTGTTRQTRPSTPGAPSRNGSASTTGSPISTRAPTMTAAPPSTSSCSWAATEMAGTTPPRPTTALPPGT